MGYDIHICRTEEWTEAVQNPITPEEWLKYITHHPKMVVYDSRISYWSERGSENHNPDEGICFLYDGEGEISVKDPAQEDFIRLTEVAYHFGAYLIGDDGEKYDAQGAVIDPESEKRTDTVCGDCNDSKITRILRRILRK